jgi:hypothetical protein
MKPEKNIVWARSNCGRIRTNRISFRQEAHGGRDRSGLEATVRRSNPAAPLSPARHAEGSGNYITKLPKAEHEAPEWQAAMEALTLVATHGGPTMFARIGVMQALNRRGAG